MRNSSIRLLICNIDCRRSTMRTDRNVVGEQPHEPVTNTTHAINHIQVNEYDDTSEVVIKTEYDGDHAVTTQGEGAGDSLLWEDSKTEISLCGKKEVDFVIKTEDDMDEMIIKQELDIEPTVLQPKTVPRPLSPPTMVRFNLRTSTSSGGDAFPTPLYRNYIMPKIVAERSRRSRKVNDVSKLRKVAKTGAERIREYRARIRALENAAVIRSATYVEGMTIQTVSQQNLEGRLVVDTRENQSLLLYDTFIRQSSQDQKVRDHSRQFVVQVDVHQQDMPLLSEAPSTSTMQMQSSTEKVTTLRRRTKTAKTPAERARAYRERKKSLKNATNSRLMIDTTHSHVDDKVVLLEASQEAIDYT